MVAYHLSKRLILLVIAGCAGQARPAMDRPGPVQPIVRASERMSLAGNMAEAEAILWPRLREPRPPAERARLLVQLGQVRTRMFWFWDARPDLAADPLEEALRLAEQTSDGDLRADARDAVGMHAYAMKLFRGEGAWAPIEAHFARALATARDSAVRARIRFHIGLTHQMQGRMYQAGREFSAVRDLARAGGDEDLVGQALRQLAAVYGTGGDRDQAIALHRASLRLRERSGNRPGVSTSHLALGDLYLEKGDDTSARRHLEAAYRIARELGLGYPQAEAAASLAQVLVRSGQAAAARPLVDSALGVARLRRDDASWGRVLLAAAEVDAALGEGDRARSRLDEARGAAARSGDADLVRACAEIARRLDRPTAGP